jgi:biofilm PGA synthesis N-glycosyltransferase PgaC
MLSAVFVAGFTALYVALALLGTRRLSAERSSLRFPHRPPLVSIIIPAYKSQKTIGDTLRSASALDYPRKEIIVVNDSPDSTPSLARSYGARVIQNRSRLGKPAALNRGTAAARGELLFFLDSDTTVSKDMLRKLVPWFSKKEVSAVMPRYLLRNPGPVSVLADLENTFTFALLRIHMFLGTLAGFRGCSVMIRKSFLEENPWPETLLEDNHLAATMVRKGHRIIWEPLAVAWTSEPVTFQELKSQKRRWGEGAYHVFRQNAGFYMRSPHFMLFFYPYFVMGVASALLLLSLAASPFLFPVLTFAMLSELVLIFISMYFHSLLMLRLGSGELLPVRALRFMVVYFPVMTYNYFRGVLLGIRRWRRGEEELNLKYW